MALAFDLELADLPPNWMPLRTVVVVECLNEDGMVALAVRSSDDLPLWALLGMLEAAISSVRSDLAGSFIDEVDD